MRRLILPLVGLLLSAACSPSAPPFSVENARAHVQMLAGSIGSRPIGSDANRRAREYLVERLREYGFNVRVQETDAERRGATARVANIIAARPGRRAQVIALVSHYDSVPDGPGAADDALGAAVCLEAGRVLAARQQPNYALALIFTDGEEVGLMGAAAVMKDSIAGWVRAVLNFDAVGSSGPPVLYETGPDSRVALDAWARSSPRPAGASYMTDIYRVLPNSTDFTVFARHLPGLNFAAAGDSYAYHTSRDTPDRLDPNLVREMGENTVATVSALDEAADLSDRSNARVIYLDIARRWAVTYGSGTALVLFAAAILAALFGWVTVLPAARELAPGRTMLFTLLWAFVALEVAIGAMLGAALLLRTVRETYQPWYAHPDRFFVYLVVAGTLGAWTMSRMGRLLPPGFRGSIQPAVAWTIILPFWLALAVAAQIFVPSAAYLAVLPLLCAGLALAVSPVRRAAGVRAASAVVLVVAGALWVGNAVILLHFAVAVFGRLPIVTPIYVYPLLLLIPGLFVVPPFFALVAGHDRRGRWQPLLGLFAFVAAWCWFAPAYTNDRPLQGSICYVNDASTGRARWQIAGNEPGIHVGVSVPFSAGWQSGPPPASFGIPLRLPLGPFAFYEATTVAEPAPVTAAGSLVREQSAAFIEIRAIPREPALAVDFNLPDGVVPEETNLAGRQQEGSPFVARYMALPAGGVTLRARITSADAERLGSGGPDARAMLVVVRNGLPGAAWPRLPAWLPQEHIVWHARSYFVVSVGLSEGPSADRRPR
jgi:hypothetical protein